MTVKATFLFIIVANLQC